MAKKQPKPATKTEGEEHTPPNWQERLAEKGQQHVLDAPMLNKLMRTFRYELPDVMDTQLQLNVSAADLAEFSDSAMKNHCLRFSQVLLGCMLDESKADPVPNSWEELEARIEHARDEILPHRLKVDGIEAPSREALKALQNLFDLVAEAAVNRAKFDRDKPIEGAYLQ